MATPQTNPILKAAAEALGGTPARPPAPAAPVAGTRPMASPRGVMRGPTAKPAAPLGNTTFDGLPADVIERRQKVATLRQRLSALAARIQQDAAQLAPLIADLADDAAALQAAEFFDPSTATKFLDSLTGIVKGLSTPPAKQ